MACVFLGLTLTGGATVYVAVDKIAGMTVQGTGTRLSMASPGTVGALFFFDVTQPLKVITDLLQGQATFLPPVK